ncbi:phage Gp37/Gp68 family protein [Rhizobium leguminosarum]|uniref:phage Gp37/Gp68 family protein n=1 Tax=Rhizobium leguminosarum TaxID=384 RepID=UPI000B926828|nr:phage Gp37/Gp68 family protein [Rhizobium leguminosarum]ASS56846.1 hypothetical protein CHR56_21070 [Rhizobium leguminosarum bv. viciae]NEI89551.1 DUF5131 family protein [Rhizobium leguminosarum]
MAETTKIEWSDSTFNPWTGCTKVSPACDNCYAEAWAKRSGMVKWGNHPRRRTSLANWREPLKWQRAADAFFAIHRRRRRVFCASLADVFDNQVDPAWRKDLFDLIRATPDLEWLLLTKRPQNIIKLSEEAGGLPANAALGTTMEDQRRADLNLPHLLIAAARLQPIYTFGSFEPMLGPIDVRWALSRNKLDIAAGILQRGHFAPGLETIRGLEWAIAGGESGWNARPAHPDWLRSLRDQCAAVAVPFLFKQWGQWKPALDRDVDDPDWRADYSRKFADRDGHQWINLAGGRGFHGQRFHVMRRMNKNLAGNELDGRQHLEFPVANDNHPELRQAALAL